MNQTEYKNMKELFTRLETEECCRNWQHIYNILSWNIPHYTRYAQTQAAQKRCVEAAARFAKLRDKMLAGSFREIESIITIDDAEVQV